MRFLVAAVLTSLALIPQADARGGGGGHGSGRGGTVGFFNAGNFGFSNVVRPGFPRTSQPFAHNRIGNPFLRQSILRRNIVQRNVVRPFASRQLLGVNRFDHGFQRWQWNGQQWTGGDFGGGWGGLSYPIQAAYGQPAAPAAAEPQTIAVTEPRQQVAAALTVQPEYNVGGCRPIANGYHCGQ